MKEETILITVEGFPERVPEGTTIAQLGEKSYGIGDQHMIVERNGRFVYPQDYGTTRVEAGDDIELVHPDFGG
jgi:thiamine biosynthesis protein ThiS